MDFSAHAAISNVDASRTSRPIVSCVGPGALDCSRRREEAGALCASAFIQSQSFRLGVQFVIQDRETIDSSRLTAEHELSECDRSRARGFRRRDFSGSEIAFGPDPNASRSRQAAVLLVERVKIFPRMTASRLQ